MYTQLFLIGVIVLAIGYFIYVGATRFREGVTSNGGTCPSGYERVGDMGADIMGAGIAAPNKYRYLGTIEECANQCTKWNGDSSTCDGHSNCGNETNINCKSFSWSPLGGDKNHPEQPVCSLYKRDTPNQRWEGKDGEYTQWMCKPSASTCKTCKPEDCDKPECKTACICNCDGGTCNNGSCVCPSGQIFDSTTGKCVTSQASCSNLTTAECGPGWIASGSGKCSGEICQPSTDCQKCGSCQAGYYAGADGICTEYTCTCDNGTIASPCTTNTEECKNCHKNYHLSGNKCVPNKCICPNGTPAQTCENDNETKCSACQSPTLHLEDNKCVENPYCQTLGSCGTGRQWKPSYQSIQCTHTPCKNETCCDPIPQTTCTGFKCPPNQSNTGRVGPCNSTNCTDGECCVPNPKPTCFGFGWKSDQCPEGYYPRSDLQSSTCEDYTCHPSDCCIEKGSCANFQCDDGFSRKSGGTCQSDQCQKGECCQPNQQCASFQCPTGYITKTHLPPSCINGTCTTGECCSPQPPAPPTPPPREEETNVFFPGATFITFENDGGSEDPSERSSTYEESSRYSEYDSWTSPLEAINFQTNNMFSEIPAQKGIGSFNTVDYNQS